MKIIKTEQKWYIVTFLMCFVPRLLVCLVDPTQMRLIPDEIGMLAGTAHFAGLNWSNVVGNTSYYGIGYYALFAPLLRVVDDYVVFQLLLRLIASFVTSIISVIGLRICRKYFHFENLPIASIICAASSYMTLGVRNISNEYPLHLITWLTVYVLLELSIVDNKKKRLALTILLTFLLFYSLSIHTRYILLIVAVFIIVTLFYILYKRVLVSVPVLVIGAMLSYIGNYIIQKWCVNSIWCQAPKGVATNTSADLTNKLVDSVANIINSSNIYAMWVILTGNIYTIIYISGGVMALALIIGCFSIYTHIKNKSYYDVYENRNRDMVFWFSFFSVFMVFAGLMVVWYPGVSKYIQGVNHETYSYFTKSIVYTRYYSSFMGPAFMVCLLSLYTHADLIKKYIGKVVLFLSILSVYWIKYIVKYVVEYKGNVREFFPMSFDSYKEADVTTGSYFYAFVCLFVIMLLMYLAARDKKIKNTYVVIVFLFLVYSKSYYDLECTTTKYSAADSSISFVNELRDQNTDFDMKIYVPSKSSSYAFQALLNKCEVIPSYPEEGTEKAVIFTSTYGSGKDLLSKGYKVLKLDNNEYAWYIGWSYSKSS